MAYNKYTINNLAQGLINTTLTAGSTTLVLQAGYGALFPSTFPFIIKCEGFLNGNVIRREIMKCTNRTTDTLTVVRSFEACPANYTALTQTSTAVQFEVGDTVSLIISKENINDMQNEITRLEVDKLNISTEIINNQNQTQIFNTSTGSSNAYVLTLTPALTSYVTGQRLVFKSNFTNTGSCTININGLGAKIIKKFGGTSDLESGDIQNGQIISIQYDGTNMQLDTPIGQIASNDFNYPFGDGSDGDLTITTTITLTKDTYYNNLTINSPGILNPNGYKVYVMGTLSGNGKIQRNGNPGGNASGITAGIGGASLNQGSLLADKGGSNGGAGTTTSSGKNDGVAGVDCAISYSNTNGATGGLGGSNVIGTVYQGLGGTGGIATRGEKYNKINNLNQILSLLVNVGSTSLSYIFGSTYLSNPGSGGGGGGGFYVGGGGTGSSGGGGGGGGNGGLLFLSIKIVNWTGTFEVIGGAGGNGGNANTTAFWYGGGGAGGAGGSGGVIVLIYKVLTSLGTTTMTGGAGGTGGTGSNGGASGGTGGTGTTGTLIQIQA